jgi:methanesulfonate monooxygenase small subunit
METMERAESNTARDRIRELIRTASRLQDSESFEEWAALFSEGGVYEVHAFSPEINRQMTWMRASRSQLEQLFKEMDNHVCEHAKRAHLVMEIHLDVTGERAAALSRFAVFKTNQRGETQIFAVGQYQDELTCESGQWRFEKRQVLLDTRMFDVFPHMTPL